MQDCRGYGYLSAVLLEFLVESARIYALSGVVFALAFAWRGAGAVDAVARHSTIGFRIIVVPGAALLWPLLAVRWWRAARGGSPANPEVPGDRTDRWSGPSERLRGRALAMWMVLAPVLAAVLVIALFARRPAALNAPDAGRLPAANPVGATR
ncbi:MAG: hypothetical protein RLZZ116_2384 [Planctomycetota bacterium]